VVELWVGDVTSGLARLLAAEIDKLPFFDCRRKSYITCERYTISSVLRQKVLSRIFSDFDFFAFFDSSIYFLCCDKRY
jgi:hypothetical protein